MARAACRAAVGGRRDRRRRGAVSDVTDVPGRARAAPRGGGLVLLDVRTPGEFAGWRGIRATRGRVTSPERGTSTSRHWRSRRTRRRSRTRRRAGGRRGDRLLPLRRPLGVAVQVSGPPATRRGTTSARGTNGRRPGAADRKPGLSPPRSRGTRCRARGRARSRCRGTRRSRPGRRPDPVARLALDEPVVEHVPRHLRVELDSPRALAEPEGLARASLSARSRARRGREPVVVPLERVDRSAGRREPDRHARSR